MGNYGSKPSSLGCVLLAGWVGAGCALLEEEEDTDTIVEANDGSATLTIPEGALPDGVSAEDIRITRNDAMITESDGGDARAWSFEPDGLAFRQPVELSLKVAVDSGQFFVIEHWSAGERTMETLQIDLERSTVDESGTLTDAVVDIGHFSDVAHFRLDENDKVSTKVAAAEWARLPNDAEVGGNVDATSRIEVPDSITYRATYVFEHLGQPIVTVADYEFSSVLEPWSATTYWLEQSKTLSQSQIITPDLSFTEPIVDRPQSFRCEKASLYNLEFHAVVVMAGERRIVFSDEPDFTQTNRMGAAAQVGIEAPGECYPGDSRTKKPEFVSATKELGSDRIEDIDSGGSDSVNLDDHQGKYGYYIQVPPGGAITVTVLGNSGITYFPEYSPGYDFVDGAPGTTTLTNKDGSNSNGVLVVLEGSGTVDITVIPAGS